MDDCQGEGLLPLVALRTRDSQERLRWITEAQVESTVVGPPRSEWGLSLVPLPTSRLMLAAEGADNVQRSVIGPEHCAFIFHMRGRSQMNGQQVTLQHAIFAPPRAECCGQADADAGWAALAVPLDVVEGRLQLLETRSRRIHAGVTLCALSQRAGETVKRLLEFSQHAAEQPDALANRTARLVLEEGLLSAAVQMLAQPVGPYRRGLGHARIFHRAYEFLEAHSETVSTSTVCEALGVSARSLYYAFQEFAGTTPGKFMRNRRLDRVRQDLLSETVASDSVTSVAMRHGFFELGRFSAQYRELFGELPRDTLRTITR